MMILAARPQLHPVVRMGRPRRLEHRRLRRALVRPRGNGRRHRRGRSDRPRRPAPSEAVRRRSCTTPTATGCRPRSRRSWLSPSTRPRPRWSRDCDVVTINAPLYPETEGLFDDALLATMKRGAYLVNTARGKICDRDADRPSARERAARRVRRRRLVSPARAGGPPVADDAPPRDDPAHLGNLAVGPGPLRRRNPRDPRVLLGRRPIRDEYLIVDGGRLAGTGAHSYSEGNATAGSEEAARFGQSG